MSEGEEAGPSRYPKTIRCSSCLKSRAFSSNLQSEEQQATLSFPKMGKMAANLPSKPHFQAVDLTPVLDLTDTCPLSEWTFVQRHTCV